jgi:hypothetical protein
MKVKLSPELKTKLISFISTYAIAFFTGSVSDLGVLGATLQELADLVKAEDAKENPSKQ